MEHLQENQEIESFRALEMRQLWEESNTIKTEWDRYRIGLVALLGLAFVACLIISKI